jgi:hypothetical protein
MTTMTMNPTTKAAKKSNVSETDRNCSSFIFPSELFTDRCRHITSDAVLDSAVAAQVVFGHELEVNTFIRNVIVFLTITLRIDVVQKFKNQLE